MTSSRSRAERRANNRRMKNKAQVLGLDVKCADHLAACSCHMCGNPRKWWKQPTIQERRLLY